MECFSCIFHTLLQTYTIFTKQNAQKPRLNIMQNLALNTRNSNFLKQAMNDWL